MRFGALRWSMSSSVARHRPLETPLDQSVVLFSTHDLSTPLELRAVPGYIITVYLCITAFLSGMRGSGVRRTRHSRQTEQRGDSRWIAVYADVRQGLIVHDEHVGNYVGRGAVLVLQDGGDGYRGGYDVVCRGFLHAYFVHVYGSLVLWYADQGICARHQAEHPLLPSIKQYNSLTLQSTKDHSCYRGSPYQRTCQREIHLP